MKRIRYNKMNSHQYQTQDPIQIKDNKLVVATFDIHTKTYAILDFRTNDIIINGNASSPHKLKIKIKNALITLGASFNSEKRYKDYLTGLEE